ncbi:MAG TPA: hypothetical protein DCR94_04945 [Firmicutes bacterium]|nr:hypothetical protein [Bacillota bacterium]
MNKELKLFYKKPALDSIEGWEKYSLPIGNGYFGASIFGGIEKERIQITTNEFANEFKYGGVSNFAEIHIFFAANNISGYERGLNLNDGTVYSFYKQKDIKVNRLCFYSYPDNVFVYKVASSSPISFSLKLVIPYLGVRKIEEGGRTGEVSSLDNKIIIRGKLPARDLIYEGQLSISSNGKIENKDGSCLVSSSTETTLIFAAGTSYKLCSETFFTHKGLGEDPKEKVTLLTANALKKGYKKLYQNHKNDYTSLMDRVSFSLCKEVDHRPTDELLSSYAKGENIPYLEEVYYQFGRHLLISSSRKGSLPSSLQGVWTAHDKSPWGSGFWHNINIQMNYWPSFLTNLDETFSAYVDFFKAYLTKAKENASDWIKEVYPDSYSSNSDYGWIIGTGAFAYEIEGMHLNTHSGPGTGGMTAQLFYDAYAFTLDEEMLQVAYDAIHGLAKFLNKCLKKYGNKYLCSYSASPEQILSGHWCLSDPSQQYYHTVGCAFDQQWIEENARHDIEIATKLEKIDSLVEEEKTQLGNFDSVLIGYSGQVKEYGEEHFYGEIGEYGHRHLSELVGLMPGSLITHKTPAWLDAAKLTLQYRGDYSTGWALAHRLCCYARVGDGNHCYKLLRTLLEKKTHPNLWDVHPPFQIDGNFGALTGMSEMLLQSHEGYISILPSIPDGWKNIYVKGLKARGNFIVNLSYENGLLKEVLIESNLDNEIKVFYKGIDSNTKVYDEGRIIEYSCNDNFISFKAKEGHKYRFINFSKVIKQELPSNFKAVYSNEGVNLTWEGNSTSYALYRADNNDPVYQFIGIINGFSFLDKTYSLSNKGRATYKLMDEKNHNQNNDGALSFINIADELEIDRYLLKLKVNNQHAEKIGWSND